MAQKLVHFSEVAADNTVISGYQIFALQKRQKQVLVA
jgi:hypothetical protein